MLPADIVIAVLVLFPPLAQALVLRVPGTELWLADQRIPLFVAAMVAVAVLRWGRAGWRRLPAEGRARLPRDAANTLAVLGALAALWHLLGFGLGAAAWHLSYGAGAVPLAALAVAAGYRWAGATWQESFFLRRGAALWEAWRGAVERAPGRALWGAVVVVGALYLWVTLARHRSFNTHFDLGLFTNAIWNLTQGNGYVSSVKGGINLFADHQSPLFWGLAPLFWLAPRAETLLAAQAFGLAAGGPALYFIARARFGRGHWATAGLPWLYWSYVPLRYANAFDFHPEVFMLPLFLWAFAGFASPGRRAKGFGLLALVAALGAKESASVVAAGIGVAWALSAGARSWRESWPGAALVAAGVALFFFDVKVVPGFFGGDYAYMGHYQRFGGGILDVLLAPLRQPALFFSQILDRDRLIFLFWTLAPLGFLPLFAWRAALAVLPVYLMLFLTAGEQRVQIHFHYGIEPATALFWALPAGLAAFAARLGWQRAGVWMLFWALACLRPFEAGLARFYQVTPHERWLAGEALPCIDGTLPTAATGALVPHLATRRWISDPTLLRQRSGEPVSCVVTDPKLDNWPLRAPELEQVLSGLPAGGYREAYRCGSFSVYERGPASCLRCKPECR